ncbi:MAG: phage portal protein, partial [Gemmataceae bacterium]
LDDFYDAQQWGEREQECIRRCDRDGEAFLRFFYVGNGQAAVRFIEPEHVRGPAGQAQASFGIETETDDVEQPLAYHVVERPAQASAATTAVPAEEILHLKVNVDSTAKRGLPTLLPVRRNLDRAEKLLRNMSVLAQVQSTFALIRRHRSQPGPAVDAYRRDQADVRVQTPGKRPRYLQQYPPGAILDAPESTEYQFPAMGVAAGGLVSILQAELRAIAARLCLPEYMLSADASNANYASTLVAEAPATRNFERLQAFFARRFGDGSYMGPASGVMWRVLARAVEHGHLPAEALTELEIQVEGQVPHARERQRESQRARLLHEAGILSRQTWTKLEGLEFEREQRQLQQEK